MDKDKTGAFIREKRKERGLTQKELAEKLHVTDQAVSKWERALSFPDITLLQQLAEILQVSIYELMQGEAEPEKVIAATQVDSLLSDTVQEVCAALKVQKRKMHLLLALWLLLLVCALLLCLFGKKLANFLLDTWAAEADVPWHSCELTVKSPFFEEAESFYLYRTQTEQPNCFLYHVMGVDNEGQSRELFCLEEKGMDLDTAPRITWDEQYVYILFQGLDNEDSGIRFNEGKVSADSQGFLPRLYRYERESGETEPVVLPDASSSLLIDAFTYEGETQVLTGRFAGLLGGLHLGFYQEDGSFLTSVGELPVNFTAEGARQTTGCLAGDSYLICAEEGIWRIDLKTGETELFYPLALSACLRAELGRVQTGKEERLLLVCSLAKEADERHIVKECRTEALLLSLDGELISRLSFDGSISALEWGEDQVMITGVREGKLIITRIELSADTLLSENLTGTLTEEEQAGLLQGVKGEEGTGRRLDEGEQSRYQWVYVPGRKIFLLTQKQVAP